MLQSEENGKLLRKWKDKAQYGKKILQIIGLIMDLYLEYIKNFHNSVTRQPN